MYLFIFIYLYRYTFLYGYINSNSISTRKWAESWFSRPVSKLLCDCQNFLCLICLPGNIFSQIPEAFFANKLQFPTVASASSLELHSWQGMAIQEACRVPTMLGAFKDPFKANRSWRTEMQPGPSCDRACLRAMRKNTDRAELVIEGKFQVWCGITWVSHIIFHMGFTWNDTIRLRSLFCSLRNSCMRLCTSSRASLEGITIKPQCNMDLLALRRQQKLIHGQSSLWLLLSLLWPIPTWKFAVGDDQTQSANSQSFARNLPHPCSSLSLSKFWQPQAKVGVTPKLPTHLQTCLAIWLYLCPTCTKKKKQTACYAAASSAVLCATGPANQPEPLEQLVDRRCPQPRWTSMCLKTLPFRQVVKHRGLPANGEFPHHRENL